jgi:dolichol-phosphate mannosyltransferase
MDLTHQPTLSVIVPVFGCRSSLESLCEKVFALEFQLGSIELILVDDASTDGGWDEIVRLAQIHSGIRGIRLPRNRGQHFAISFGIRHSRGRQLVLMDCDLENDPEDIPLLLAELSDLVRCVVGLSNSRSSTSLLRRMSRRMYSWLLSVCYLVDINSLGVNSFSFCALDGELARSISETGIPSDPISFRLLDSAISIKSTRVNTKRRSTGRSTYRLSDNLLIIFKSVLMSGKGFQLLCIRVLISLGLSVVALSLAFLLFVGREELTFAAANLVLLIFVIASLLITSLSLFSSVMFGALLARQTRTFMDYEIETT